MKYKSSSIKMVSNKSAVAEAILNGASASKFAKEYGEANVTIVRAVNRYCLESNPVAYRRIGIESKKYCPSYNYSIEILRSYKDEFLNKIDNLSILESCSIWRLNSVPTTTLGGLYHFGLNTIEDILKYNFDELRMIRCVGKKGANELREALIKLGFELPSPKD